MNEQILYLAKIWVFLMDEYQNYMEQFTNDPDDAAKAFVAGMFAIQEKIDGICGGEVDVYATWQKQKIVLVEA